MHPIVGFGGRSRLGILGVKSVILPGLFGRVGLNELNDESQTGTSTETEGDRQNYGKEVGEKRQPGRSARTINVLGWRQGNSRTGGFLRTTNIIAKVHLIGLVDIFRQLKLRRWR